MPHCSKLIRFYDVQVTKTASSAQKEDSKDPQTEAEAENIVTYTGFGFSGWKSGLQRLFLTTKGTFAFSCLIFPCPVLWNRNYLLRFRFRF